MLSTPWENVMNMYFDEMLLNWHAARSVQLENASMIAEALRQGVQGLGE